MRLALIAAASAGLAACTPPSEAARQHAAAAPPPSPRGILASHPPQDSSFYPLRCLTNGPETVCKRDTD